MGSLVVPFLGLPYRILLCTPVTYYLGNWSPRVRFRAKRFGKQKPLRLVCWRVWGK